MKKAMMFAAGFGSRLKPYSLSRPKPLFPVLDKPLILHVLDQLHDAGFQSIVANVHHLYEQIVRIVRGFGDIQLLVEQEILGTGGGLRAAMSCFDEDPVLIVNSDVYHDFDLAGLYESHCRSEAEITLVFHDYPRFNTVMVESGKVTGFSPDPNDAGKSSLLAFTGIHIINPAVIRQIPPESFCNIIDFYTSWLGKGRTIRAEIVTQRYWCDIGTIRDYLGLHSDLLAKNPGTGTREQIYIGEGVKLGKGVVMRDWVCVGSGVRIGDNVDLSRVVVWDGADIPSGTKAFDTLLV
ncbi:sugar phosphate nucleotidyltransferase [Thermodesulfobacteriota bacterium]